jgi:O-methyltransferase involved in polyketide biosynthesis/GNAT superfamily N-acetyltransferase
MAREDPATILRTAKDAIQAKLSALEHYKCAVAATKESEDIESSYNCLLRSMAAMAADSSGDASKNMSSTAPRRVRRQTPLINIGYAMRVACMKHSIQQFVQFYSFQDEECQIVILGAGWDVMGLWLLLSKSMMQLRCAIHIIEVDFPSLCDAKRKAIEPYFNHNPETGFEVEYRALKTNNDNSNLRMVLNAHRNVTKDPSCVRYSREEIDEYSLIAGDLQNQDFVDDLFAGIRRDRQIPTLVVCELVLAYLKPEACDHLLRCVAKSQCSLLAYEPMLNTNKNQDLESTVLKSYQRLYLQHLDDKLKCGQVTTEETDPLFHPMGSSVRDVQRRLGATGFRWIEVGRVGSVAARIKTWKANELFDEHAALALHAASYAVVCAFPDLSSTDSQIVDQLLLRRWMCGKTISGHYCDRPHWKSISETSPSLSHWIMSIERADEGQVRKLFSDAYEAVAKEYPAVRKMVKNALRTYLGSNDGHNNSTLIDTTEEFFSVIRQKFIDLGGDFLVFIDATTSDENCRKVRGGIGFRACKNSEKLARNLADDETIPCYEIHHMFVDRDFQNTGVGSALLQAVVDAVQQKHRYHDRDLVFLATTLSILKSANEFYTSKGFVLNQEQQKGELLYRDFVLTIRSTRK